jgi:exosortase
MPTKTLNIKLILLGSLSVALFAAAYYPAFRILVSKWSNSEEYSHAFLTLPILLYMVWGKKTVLLDKKQNYNLFGLVLVLSATVSYLFALLTQVPTFISMSLYFTIVGVLVYLMGVRAISILFTPLILLLLLIPVPDQLYIKLTFPLQLKVSQISELLVGFFGVPVLREGNVMNIPGKSFEVVEACSGMRSIITLLTLSLIMGYFMLKMKSSKIVLLLTSIPIAIVVNIIRVSMMILLYHFFRLDLSGGFLHTLTGLLVFAIALILLLFVHKVLELWETK